MSNVVQFPSAIEPEPQSGPVRLYLGCNQNPQPGYINVDIEQYAGVDVVADLEKKWPWPDASVDEIYTADLPEHLRQWWDEYDVDSAETVADIKKALQHPRRVYGIIHFMNECWRVLKSGGILRAKIPTTESKAWAQDPTHVSYWNENSFLYFIEGGYAGIYPKQIQARFQPLEVKTYMPNQKGEAWVAAVLRKP